MNTFDLKTTVFIFTLMLYTLSACGQKDFERLPDNKVETAMVDIGEKFINDFYATLENGATYNFTTANATPEVQNTFTPEMQKTTFEQIRAQLGKYENATYTEAWVQAANPDYIILRYKAKFSNNTPKVEIRVVLNKSNKIAGFFVKPWSDALG